MAHAGGRPTDYNDQTCIKAQEYLDSCVDEEYSRIKSEGGASTSYDNYIRVKLPSIAGLAMFLDVTRATIYDWKEKYPEFLYILDKILAAQEQKLLEGGMSGLYNSTISKVILTKHGYVDKVEEKQELSGGLTIGWATPKSDE